MDAVKSSCSVKRVLMLPWLAYGHVSPFLELAKQLSKRNFHVYFCSTAINLTSIKKNLRPDFDKSIQLVELQLPSQSDLPPHHHTTNGLPITLVPALIQAFEMSSLNFVDILNTLNPNLIIYDIFETWLPPLAVSRQIPAVHFQIFGAVTASWMYTFLFEDNCTPLPFSPSSFQDMNETKKKTHGLESAPGGKDSVQRTFDAVLQSSDIILINSFRAMEAKYMDQFSLLTQKKIVPMGPLIQDGLDIVDEKSQPDTILEWLSKKDELSTVYVSFGSQCYLSTRQVEELAYGLELSNVNFIWVIRFPRDEKVTNIEHILPQGFLERVKERGMIVNGWAPQAKILANSGIGGFVSHCGWNSVMESMSYGVPIIAMPMQYDQPFHAMLVAEIGVGVDVVKDESGDFTRDKIVKAIKEVVVEKTGKGARKRARELSEKIKVKGEEDMDVVVEELTKVCSKYYKSVPGDAL